MLEAKSKASKTKGQSPIDLGYKLDNFKAIELKYDLEFNTDILTIFFQKNKEDKGRGFQYILKTKEYYDFFFELYNDCRQQSRRSIADIVFENLDIDPDMKPLHLED